MLMSRKRKNRAIGVVVSLLSGLFVLVAQPAPAVADTFAAAGFTTEVVATLPQYSVVGTAFAPDGRMFVWTKPGVVRIVKNGQLLPTPFLDLTGKVNTYDDRGMWGFALDPDFATNGYVYLTYVYENTANPDAAGPKTSRLVRVTADPNNPDVALPGSETVILGSVGTAPCSNQPAGADCIPADGGSHSIGGLLFGPDGKLFLGNGDGAEANALSLGAQDLNSYRGKILRINKDGTAPADNPFYDGTNSVKSKVFLYGVRNPFRFALQPGTGHLWFGDVGWNTWEEINDGVPGANYGWPCYEGTNPQPTFQQQYSQCQALAASSVTAPYYTYNHTVGSAVIGGPFYTADVYPAQYKNNFFFADYSGNYIKRVVFDGNNNPIGVQPFATNVDAPVSLVVGPDGMIYYLSFTTGQVRRIRFNGPSAHATATPQYGYSPLQVAFSSAGSVDAGGGTLSYLWDFGDGTTSTAANPTHTYTAAGVQTFTAKLTVTGAGGLTSTATTTVTVGSSPPVPTISAPLNNTAVLPGQTINYAGSATDPDQGPLPASALSWTVLLHHDTHIHKFVGGTGANGSFVVEDHGPIGTFSYEVILTATDSSGLSSSTSVLLPVGSDTSPPTAPANLTATANGSNVSLNWAASTDNIKVSGYRLERCQGADCTNFAQIATPTGATATDPGLAPGTTYQYRVAAADPSGNVSAYSNTATVTISAAPAQPSGLVAGYTFDAGTGTTVTDVSGNGNTGTISGATWDAGGRFGGALKFNGSSDAVKVPSSASLNLSAELTLAAWVKPAASQQGWRTIMQKENEAWFLDASSGAGPLRPAGGVTGANNTNAIVTGPTASPLNQWTHVAMTYNGTALKLYVNGTQVATNPKSGALQQTSNPLSIGGNTPYGEYFAGLLDDVRVYNRALSDTELQTIMNSPLVPPVADTTPPSTVTALTATANGAAQVNLSWPAASDNVAVSGYQLERCQGAGCTNFAAVGTVGTTSYADGALTASTTYTYRVRATDAAGNLGGWSPAASATTAAAADTTAPSAPAGLTASVAGNTQINLTWTGSTDDVGVTQYRIERCSGAGCTNFAQVATATTPTYANTGLTAGTAYQFRVRAADAAGNLSAYSNVASATTTATDTTKPTAPTALSATAAGPTQVDLSWTASTDNVGVTGYRVERCTGASCTSYAEVAQPTGTTWSDTGRSPSTTYRYRVRATDAAGNLSAYSSVVSATTPALPDSTPPSTPASLTATPNGTQVALSWPASTDNVSVAGYRVQRCTGSGCTDFAQVATPTTNAYTDAGLVANTTYLYRVAAVDPSGNVSGWSPTASATTTNAPTQPTGLIAGYNFDAGSGTTVADLSGNGNAGTITGATWVTGKYGSALSFNGTSDIVRIPASSTLLPSTGLTLAAWIQPTAAQNGWRTVMQKENDAWFLNASNTTGALYPAGGITTSTGASSYCSGTSASPVNAWTHIALTYDGTDLRLYVNGVQVSTKPIAGALQQTSNPLSIGGNGPYGEYFKGLIDEARVYNRALTQAEVQTVMNTPLS
ncbi:LamG-like jellyroll fold domain-containing protein [Dactylosporangium sp. NPDC051484]|uniref:LamG-like jellyroll fold domain-containing protein n=1 Tax=Dactylosporangium sp. NPDC051484 TaxID=3154942 RepID=UPI00344D6C4C